jgi:hypothetical protein
MTIRKVQRDTKYICDCLEMGEKELEKAGTDMGTGL